MNPYEMIKQHLSSAVPFANHVGVKLLEIGDGVARAELDQRGEVQNHIDTMHAGAMFTLGEAASGAALAGAFGPAIMQLRPVAATASIAYKKIARGLLTAHAKAPRSGSALMSEIEAEGKVAFDITVDIQDAAGETVVEMTVNWHVSKQR